MFFTNQIRMKIGVMFGSPETTTGGNALKFYASVRLDVRRVGAIKEAPGAASASKEASVVGNRTRVKVVKNKLAPPFREVEFDILYGKGVSRSGEVLDMATDLGLVQKSGAWYAVDSERIGQGRDNARAYLEEHPERLEKLARQVLEKSGIGGASKPAEADGVSARPASGDAAGDDAKARNAAARRAARAN